MKEYVIRLVIHEGQDEFWKSNPTPEELMATIEECLYDHGFHDDISALTLVGYMEGEPRWN